MSRRFSRLAITFDSHVFRIIQSQYQYINQNYSIFNSGLLNASAEPVKAALARDSTHNTSPYMVAVLRAYNATMEDPTSTDPVPTAPHPSQGGGSSQGSSQSLAMIILYVIVSVVSALFVIVILSGVSAASI